MIVARRPFLHNGHQYQPGDVVKGFPENFGYRSETFLMTGLVKEVEDPKPARKTKKMEEIKAE
jgi:hypothetical protein